MCLKSFLLDKDVLGNWDFGKNVIHEKKGEISISTQDNEQPSHIKKKWTKWLSQWRSIHCEFVNNFSIPSTLDAISIRWFLKHGNYIWKEMFCASKTRFYLGFQQIVWVYVFEIKCLAITYYDI